MPLVNLDIRLGGPPDLLREVPRAAPFQVRDGGSGWSLGRVCWPTQSVLDALTSQS